MWWHRARLTSGLLGVVLAALLAAGCAPQSPDRSSWLDQAHTAVQDASSEVATVGLLLQLESEGRVPGQYQQVVVQDSEAALGEVAARFGAEQPPPGDDARYHEVTTALSDASDLVSDVRIAIVRRDTASYPSLRDDLATMSDRLAALQADLEGPGR